MSYFDTYGPFPIKRDDGAFTGHQADFWRGIEKQWRGLPHAIGCYLFCLEHRGRIRPWYVGQTRSKSGFKGEVFQSHKRQVYGDVLEKRLGLPLLFFFPLMTSHDRRFSHARAESKRVIDWLEITLMGFAHRQNPEISNIRDMKYLRNVEVLGLLGKRRGRPYREAQEIRHTLLGATRRKLSTSVSNNA